MLDIIGSAFRPIRRLTCLFRCHRDGVEETIFDGWMQAGGRVEVDHPERCISVYGPATGGMRRVVVKRLRCVRCGG